MRSANGTAEANFMEDLKTTAKYGVKGFPTFLIKYGTKELILRSYQSFESFRAAIMTISGNELTEIAADKSEKSVLDFIMKYNRVAPIEIETTFDFSQSDLNSVINKLADKGQINIIPAGNGSFIEATLRSLSCDPKNSQCAI